MLLHVRMEVKLPVGLDPQEASDLKKREKAYSQTLQRDGTWLHLWRVAGIMGNISIFDVPDIETLHEVLTGLPLFPYITFEITPLCCHPSRIDPSGMP